LTCVINLFCRILIFLIWFNFPAYQKNIVMGKIRIYFMKSQKFFGLFWFRSTIFGSLTFVICNWKQNVYINLIIEHTCLFRGHCWIANYNIWTTLNYICWYLIQRFPNDRVPVDQDYFLVLVNGPIDSRSYRRTTSTVNINK